MRLKERTYFLFCLDLFKKRKQESCFLPEVTLRRSSTQLGAVLWKFNISEPNEDILPTSVVFVSILHATANTNTASTTTTTTTTTSTTTITTITNTYAELVMQDCFLLEGVTPTAPPDVPPRNPTMNRMNNGRLVAANPNDLGVDFEPSCLVRTPSGNVYIPSDNLIYSNSAPNQTRCGFVIWIRADINSILNVPGTFLTQKLLMILK
uniref:Uncharacterized protein n=1 Tax=Glossina pallidipes TaxID=7398 RepID=A0A1B0AG42_GLOPL